MDVQGFWNKVTYKHIVFMLILATAGITIQTYLGGHAPHTRHNNFVIFSRSFEHLLNGRDLYTAYPGEYYDLFKYSPSFAFFMGAFYYLTPLIGLLLFNFLNIGVFIFAVKRLRFSEISLKYFFLYVLLEALISISSSQTNLLMAGLIIWGFVFLEEEKPGLASLCIVLSIFIKIFGAVALILWILYPKKIRFIIYCILWIVIIWALPLLLVSKSSLFIQYQQWFALLQSDHEVSYGASLMGILHSWFSLEISGSILLSAGTVLLLLPYLKTAFFRLYPFRLQMLASVLIWMVIFNHKAESPTYIIAMSGVAIWYFSQPGGRLNGVLFILCLVFTSFSSTDLITPGWINNRYVQPYAIKAVFCTIIWIKLMLDSFSGKSLIIQSETFQTTTLHD
jgi:hypothetical protein